MTKRQIKVFEKQVKVHLAAIGALRDQMRMIWNDLEQLVASLDEAEDHFSEGVEAIERGLEALSKEA